MNRLFSIIIIIVLFLPVSSWGAEDYNMTAAREQLRNYNNVVANRTPGAQAYNSELSAVNSFIKAIHSSSSDSPEYAECRRALRELFPVMSDGAYFFAGLDNPEKVLQFACAHIDISLLPVFAAENLKSYATYPVLSYLAATNLFNRADYDRAVRYYQAYLETTDLQNRELSFEGLSRCFYEQKDYGRAAYIASQGVGYYPNNWNMLLIGIESFGNTGQDDKMEPLINKALSISPGHKGLMEYQGKMYERQRRFDYAAQTFEKLLSANNSSLDYTLHLGFNLYNAGIQAIQADKSKGAKNAASNPYAKSCFTKAAPYLQRVLDNAPYAANVARALAMCYAMTNDAAQLEKANQNLAAMKVNQVSKYEVPTLDMSYKPTVDLTPINQQIVADNTPMSDVDIDIPVTGLRKPDTYVVVFGNEKYKHKTDVPYANHDAKIFAEYCKKTLGIPADNIRECYDATFSEIQTQIRYLSERAKMSPNKLNFIFYYAGHGVPEVCTNTGYLLPVDSDGTDFSSCISINGLADQFDDMPVNQVSVFLDACFSGGSRTNEMLFTERFVELEVEDFVAKGNTVIFSATDGKQTAMGYDDQHHGFFTYYLLKSLQESNGKINFKDLSDYLLRNVESKSYDKKNKRQTPKVTASKSLGNSWHTRTL